MNIGRKEDMMMRFKMRKYLIGLVFFIIIFYTQFLHPVNGLADDQMGLVTAEKVIQSINRQEGYRDLMEKYIETGGLHPASALGLPMINPIYTLVTHGYSSIIGLSIPKWHFLSVLIFIGLLILAYKLGKFFFGQYGFIFPLLLAVNLYILVVIRNSIVLFSISMLIQFGTLYFFLTVHEKFQWKTFGLSALFLFLALSNGSTYSPVTYLYLLIILFALIVWKIIAKLKGFPLKEFRFLAKKYYFLIFVAVPLLSIISYFANDLLLNLPLGSSLDGFLYYTKSRFPPSEFPTFSDKISGSIIKFGEVFRGTSFREIFGPHATFFPYKTPVLDTASAFLFFLGLLSFLKNFTYKKLILFVFLCYTFAYIYDVGAARIFIVFVPFLLLISSAGFVFLIQIVKALKFKKSISLILFLALGLLLAKNVYYFDNYFVVKSNSNMMRGAGIGDVKAYIDSLGKNKILVFMDRGYPFWYLADFKQTDFVINTQTEPEELRKTIQNLEENYGQVILVFPTDLSYVGNPGVLNTISEEFSTRFRFFQDAFPQKTMADKTIYDYQGIPQHYLYRFAKNEDLPKTKRLIFKESEKTLFGFSGEIDSVRIRGGIKKIKLGDNNEIHIQSSPSSEVLLNFGQESFYTFYLNYGNDSFKENLNQEEKSQVDKKFNLKKISSLTWIEPNIVPDQPPYVLEYLFDFPYQIKEIGVKTDMRLFNAAGSQAAIRGYLVKDEKHFTDYLKKGNRFSFLDVESDNSNTYAPGGEINVLDNYQWGIGRLSSYKVSKPKGTKKVLISMLFESKYYTPGYFQENLYNIGDSSFIKFTLDSKNIAKPKVTNNTVLSVEIAAQGEKPVTLDLIYH